MTFDQTADRAAVEAEMLDSVIIERDAQGIGEDVLNQTTLELVPPTPDASTVYAGPCTLSPATSNTARTEGQRQDTRQEWNCRIPLAAPLPQYGDRATITAVHTGGDATLVGARFMVNRVYSHTIGVSRRLTLQDEKAVTVR